MSSGERTVERWGAVEETAPPLGVVWIRTQLGERSLLDIREHSPRAFPTQGVRTSDSWRPRYRN